jgi:hypothetical protein
MQFGAVSFSPREVTARIVRAGHTLGWGQEGTTLLLEMFTFPRQTRNYCQCVLSAFGEQYDRGSKLTFVHSR